MRTHTKGALRSCEELDRALLTPGAVFYLVMPVAWQGERRITDIQLSKRELRDGVVRSSYTCRYTNPSGQTQDTVIRDWELGLVEIDGERSPGRVFRTEQRAKEYAQSCAPSTEDLRPKGKSAKGTRKKEMVSLDLETTSLSTGGYASPTSGLDLSKMTSLLDQISDLNKVGLFTTGVFPKMMPTASLYDRPQWEVQPTLARATWDTIYTSNWTGITKKGS